MTKQVLLDAKEINKIINRLAKKIAQEVDDFDKFAIVGIQTRGVELARRIKAKIEESIKKSILSGTLDVSFFRDDLATRGTLPVMKETDITFDISGLNILLVDDVIFTGRTIKAALETLMTFGRPARISLLSFVDRGNRQLPFQPDYCGYKVKTRVEDDVKVLLNGVDKEPDSVVHIKDKSK